jgi:hypothetical protein
MAWSGKRRGGSGNKPKYSLQFSVKTSGGDYKKGPSIGLWDAESGPMARGSTKGEYAEQLAEFFDKYCGKESGISVSLFENDEKSFGNKRKDRDDDDEDRSSRRRKKRDRDEDEDEEEEEEDEEDDDEEEEDDEEEDDEEEDEPKKKKKKSSSKKTSSKKSSKKAKGKKRKFG